MGAPDSFSSGSSAELPNPTHNAQHSPRTPLLSTMRKIFVLPSRIDLASRTLPHHRNLLFSHSGIQQLSSIRLPQIQINFGVILVDTNSKKVCRIPKPLVKLVMYLLAHRVAASTNARPNRRLQ